MTETERMPSLMGGNTDLGGSKLKICKRKQNRTPNQGRARRVRIATVSYAYNHSAQDYSLRHTPEVPMDMSGLMEVSTQP